MFGVSRNHCIPRYQSIRILRQALVAHIFEPFQSFFNQKNEKTTPQIDNLSSYDQFMSKSYKILDSTLCDRFRNDFDIYEAAKFFYLVCYYKDLGKQGIIPKMIA